MSNQNSAVDNSLYVKDTEEQLEKLSETLKVIDNYSFQKTIELARLCLKYSPLQKGDRVYLNKDVKMLCNTIDVSYKSQKYAWGTIFGILPRESGYCYSVVLDNDWYWSDIEKIYKPVENYIYNFKLEDLTKIPVVNGVLTGNKVVYPGEVEFQGDVADNFVVSEN